MLEIAWVPTGYLHLKLAKDNAHSKLRTFIYKIQRHCANLYLQGTKTLCKIQKYIFMNIHIISKGLINHKPSLIQKIILYRMADCHYLNQQWPSFFLMHICVTQPRVLIDAIVVVNSYMRLICLLIVFMQWLVAHNLRGFVIVTLHGLLGHPLQWLPVMEMPKECVGCRRHRMYPNHDSTSIYDYVFDK